MHCPHLSAITLNHTGSSVPHSSDSVGRNSMEHHLIYSPLIQSVLPVIIDYFLEVDVIKVSVLMIPDVVVFSRVIALAL